MPKGSKSGKSKKEDKKEEKIEDKHPGYGCLYLGDKELKGYGFKTGDGLLDVAPFKTLKRDEIIEEIKFKGKMCAFQPFQSMIEKYENEDILFIWDPDEEKEADCNFYFCSTIETLEIEKNRLGISDDGLAMDPEEIKRKKEEEERLRLEQEAKEEEKREEERINSAIKELKKPLIARKWIDLGSFDEIMKNKIRQNRIRTRISISRKRKYFGLKQQTQFSDQENVDGMNIEIKSLQTGSSKYGYDVYKKLCDKNNQIGNKMTMKSTQTNWRRKINKIVQYEFNEFNHNKKNENISTSTSTPTMTTQTYDDIFGFEQKMEEKDDKSGILHDIDNNNDDQDMNEKLEQFLEDIYDELQDMLTDNNLVNIFEDDFNLFIDNDKELGLDTKTENIKEIQTFVDLNWSRGKKISDIQWMPSSLNDDDNNNNNMIAVSCIENMSFDDRVSIMNKSRISSILLWNLSHILLKAQTILTAPNDIFTFKFHPYNKNIIIGGLESGQVILWDLNDYHQKQQQQKEQQQVTNNNDDVIDTIDDENPLLKINNNDIDIDDEDEKIPQIEAKMLSYIEKSHTKCVTDILWLPQDIMIDSNGELQYIDIKNRPKGSKMLNEEQFMSISGDGSILFWDIQIPKQTEKEKKKNEPAKWVPIYMKKLEKKNLNENIFVDKDAMDLAKYDANIMEQQEQKEKEEEEEDGQGEEEDIDDKNNNNDNGSPSEIIFGSRMCLTPLLGKLAIGTELGEYCLFNYGKINKEFISSRQSLLLSLSATNKTTTSYLEKEDESKDDENKDELFLQNSLIYATNVDKNIYCSHFLDISSILISPHFSDIYLTIGDWRFCIWKNNKLVFISPYCSTYISCGCWSPTRPGVIICAKYDGTIDIWDLLDETHCPIIKNSPISSTSISSIIFDNNHPQNILAVGDNNGNLRILQIPRNFVIPLMNEKLLMAQFYEKEYIRIKYINKRYNKNKLKTIQIEKIEKEQKEKEKEKEELQQQEKKIINDDDIPKNEMEKEKENDRKIQEKYENMLVAFKKQLGIKDNNNK